MEVFVWTLSPLILMKSGKEGGVVEHFSPWYKSGQTGRDWQLCVTTGDQRAGHMGAWIKSSRTDKLVEGSAGVEGLNGLRGLSFPHTETDGNVKQRCTVKATYGVQIVGDNKDVEQVLAPRYRLSILDDTGEVLAAIADAWRLSVDPFEYKGAQTFVAYDKVRNQRRLTLRLELQRGTERSSANVCPFPVYHGVRVPRTPTVVALGAQTVVMDRSVLIRSSRMASLLKEQDRVNLADHFAAAFGRHLKAVAHHKCLRDNTIDVRSRRESIVPHVYSPSDINNWFTDDHMHAAVLQLFEGLIMDPCGATVMVLEGADWYQLVVLGVLMMVFLKLGLTLQADIVEKRLAEVINTVPQAVAVFRALSACPKQDYGVYRSLYVLTISKLLFLLRECNDCDALFCGRRNRAVGLSVYEGVVPMTATERALLLEAICEAEPKMVVEFVRTRRQEFVTHLANLAQMDARTREAFVLDEEGGVVEVHPAPFAALVAKRSPYGLTWLRCLLHRLLATLMRGSPNMSFEFAREVEAAKPASAGEVGALNKRLASRFRELCALAEPTPSEAAELEEYLGATQPVTPFGPAPA